MGQCILPLGVGVRTSGDVHVPGVAGEEDQSLPPLDSRSPMRRTAPAWATILVLSLCGMVSALQFTLVIPLLPEFPQLLASRPRTPLGSSPPRC